jgi:hypothetical protein
MAKSFTESSSEFVSPSILEALKQELSSLEAMEPGSKPTAEAIAELLPLIKGCRDRGHSWVRIAQSFQKYLPGVTVGTLRKVAFELDPSLKGAVKGVNLAGASESLIPALDGLEDQAAVAGSGLDLDEGTGSTDDSEEKAVSGSTRKSKQSAVSF